MIYLYSIIEGLFFTDFFSHSRTYPQIPENIAPGETAVISATHSMDFELIQNVRVTGYNYYDESGNYTNININNAPFMNIYENWTKNKQLGIN